MSNCRNRYKILILCDFNRHSANTIIDHVISFKKYSRHDLFFFNPVRRAKPHWLNLEIFDLIIIHYSIYVLSDHYLNAHWRQAVSRSRAVKIQFIQDEYRRVHAIHERIKDLKIGILYTCFPESEIQKIYPLEKFPEILKINTLTGYVPEYFQLRRPDFDKKRTIDVGYRGRGGGPGEGFWWLGSLYQDKSIISREFLRHAQETGLRCDISSREKDRIYGKKWIHFLENCRCTLGTESGASVIDFTGDVETDVKKYCQSHRRATFEEIQSLFLKDLEGEIRMNQISPRAFEAIGCGCCQILFVGEYSGILKPDIHYIPLQRDFGNISEVLAKVRDESLTKQIARRAYDDIIASGHYSYRTFMKSVDRQIEVYMRSPGFKRAVRMSEDSRLINEKQKTQPEFSIGQQINSEIKNFLTQSFSLSRNDDRGKQCFHLSIFFLQLFLRLGRRIYLLHPFFLNEELKLIFYARRYL